MFKTNKVLAGMTALTMSMVPISVIGDISANRERNSMVYETYEEKNTPAATSTTSSCFTTTSTTCRTSKNTTTTITSTTTRSTTTTTEITTQTKISTEEVVTEAITETETEDSFTWSGKVLNTFDGIINSWESPSGYRETYYNMDMYGCLDLMELPYDGYAEREDGVKTYNGYVMVATPDLEAYPKGSYIPTTLGMGLVVDYCPGGNLDIAVNW